MILTRSEFLYLIMFINLFYGNIFLKMNYFWMIQITQLN